MNKEQLYKKLLGYGSLNEATLTSILEPFFSSNVVIPKGENRHPDADAIHCLAERTSIVEIKSNEPNGTWGIEGINDFSYRIKPSEPIYEWQWKYWIEGRDAYDISGFKTEREIEVYLRMSGVKKFVKDEETKRVRKA